MAIVLAGTIILFGLSGIVAQIILLREFLIVFFGNELVIGVILGNWVLCESLGVYFSARIVSRVKNAILVYSIYLLVFAAAFPVSIFFSRVIKMLIGIPVGEAAGFLTVFLATLIINAVLSFCHGGLFSCALKLNTQSRVSPARGISMVYSMETIGTLVGGMLLSFFFMGRWNSFQTASVIALAHAVAVVILSGFFLQGKAKGYVRGCSIGLIMLFLAVPADFMHTASLGIQWRGVEIQEYKNSVYGNIMVTRQKGQQTIFYNGIPAVVTPFPDIASLEEFAHFPLLLHEHPENILVINAAAGGFIREMLKHNPQRIDYIELDPSVIGMLKKYPTVLTSQELSDQRVHIAPVDGAFFVRTANTGYDVVLIGVSQPADLTLNRFFTLEFFNSLRRIAKPGSIIAFRLPGSQTYISRELRDLNACIYQGLKSVFPCVRVIPGDLMLYCASADTSILKLSADDLMRRFEARRISASVISLPYLRYRLDSEAELKFINSLRNYAAGTNQDMVPVALYYMQVFWNKQFSPGLVRLFRLLKAFKLPMVVAAIFLGVFFVLFFLRKSPEKLRDAAIIYSIASTGFLGMLLNLILIFAFQVYYGFIYQWIGILVAVFMAGAGLGSFLMALRINKIEKPFKLLCFFELFALILSVCLSVILPGTFMQREAASAAFLFLFLILGILIGAEFPLACRLNFTSVEHAGMAASSLYFVDLLGGWGAGLLGGIFFLPILGIVKSCIVLAVLKLSSLLFLFVTRKRK
ncbi:MAG: hypothetical protein WDL87_06345 [Candidatus Omnitrophota bacterium]